MRTLITLGLLLLPSIAMAQPSQAQQDAYNDHNGARVVAIAAELSAGAAKQDALDAAAYAQQLRDYCEAMGWTDEDLSEGDDLFDSGNETYGDALADYNAEMMPMADSLAHWTAGYNSWMQGLYVGALVQMDRAKFGEHTTAYVAAKNDFHAAKILYEGAASAYEFLLDGP